MNKVIDLQRIIPALTLRERESLPRAACNSVIGDTGAASDRNIDPESIDFAARRYADTASGEILSIDHAELMRRTAGIPECHGF